MSKQPFLTHQFMRRTAARCVSVGEGCLLALEIVIASIILGSSSLGQQQARMRHPEIQQDFQRALVAFQTGNYKDAAVQLRSLESEAPDNSSIHELLGLVYGAQSRETEALGELRTATSLDPTSVPARDNLGTCLVRSGLFAEAEEQWRQALRLDPKDYGANHNLAKLLLSENHVMEARPLLVLAQESHPDALDNGYDLALADLLLQRYTESRQVISAMQHQDDSGELHNLLGRIDEQEGKFVDAANEFGSAAHLDASEDNLFVWASELLLHRTYEPAIEVFSNASQRFPNSQRVWVGLGMALYSRGYYERSIRALLNAVKLNPVDARCYLFLSKAYLSAPGLVDQVIERFRTYADLQPHNALAKYYYGVSLWKGGRLEHPDIDYIAVESLLKQSIAIDNSIAAVHLQLGILYSDQRFYDKALPELERAVQLDPNLVDAHFRLGRSYLRAGDKHKADAELEIFKQLRLQHQAELDKERAEVKQFVVSSVKDESVHP